MKNIHVLPTDKPSRLYKTANFLLLDSKAMPNNTLETKNLNIYITNDEEIEEGDYGYNLISSTIDRFTKSLLSNKKYYKKIILTTDPELIANGVQAIDDEFLEWFVKNPSCESVEIEDWHNKFLSCCRSKEDCYCNKKRIIIPQEEPKQELPQLGTKEFNDLASAYFGGELNDLASAYFGGKPKQETLEDSIYQAIGLAANEQGIINQALATSKVMDVLKKQIYETKND
jgi:hypothetical protein